MEQPDCPMNKIPCSGEHDKTSVLDTTGRQSLQESDRTPMATH